MGCFIFTQTNQKAQSIAELIANDICIISSMIYKAMLFQIQQMIPLT